MKPVLLVLIALSDESVALLNARFTLHYAPGAARRAAAVEAHGPLVDVVLTTGTEGLRADEVDAMPRLSLVCALGAGYENLPLDHARARGIALANGAGTNDDCVADHAMALLLAVVRAVPQQDRACRDGVWRDALPTRPQLAGKRMGILGLGTIGRKIARRGAAFDVEVGYHSRSSRPDVDYRYFDDVIALARWCDILVVAAPGGPATKHLVNAPVLEALGQGGFLVNIARGSIVDTAALADALRGGAIAGAALDVYESEPLPPTALIGLANVVLTPHVGGASPEAKQASLQCFLDNAALHFSGKPLRTPI